MNKIVLLDFCETVIKLQTFNPFVLKIISDFHPYLYKIITNKFVKKFFVYLNILLRKCSYNGYFDKVLMIRLLNGISRKTMDAYAKDYYLNILLPNINEKTLETLNKFQSDGCRIIIVSGACDLYLKYFASEHGIKDIVSTEFYFVNDICTGKINGLDCIDKNKIIKLKEYMRNNNISGEFYACITDSITDKPLLDLCKKKIVVSRNCHQKWVTEDMTEIIW